MLNLSSSIIIWFMFKFRKLDNQGYTVLELLAVLVIFTTMGVIFSYLLRQNAADARDIERKRDVNALYFQLEASKTANGYPEKLSKETLLGLDPEAFVDPKKVELGQPNAEYRYYPANCSNGFCQSYEIKVNLEKEAEYIKKSAG